MHVITHVPNCLTIVIEITNPIPFFLCICELKKPSLKIKKWIFAEIADLHDTVFSFGFSRVTEKHTQIHFVAVLCGCFFCGAAIQRERHHQQKNVDVFSIFALHFFSVFISINWICGPPTTKLNVSWRFNAVGCVIQNCSARRKFVDYCFMKRICGKTSIARSTKFNRINRTVSLYHHHHYHNYTHIHIEHFCVEEPTRFHKFQQNRLTKKKWTKRLLSHICLIIY